MNNVVALHPSALSHPTIATAALPLVENGFVPIPIKPGLKIPIDTGWNQFEVTKNLIDEWVSKGKGGWGVGIRTRYTPAVDIDISDEHIAEKVLAWCRI